MAKIREEVIAGVVTKVMRCIGWVVINVEERCYNEKVYSSYSMAKRVCDLYGKEQYEVKPIYIEEM
jgi:hypothetical protein